MGLDLSDPTYAIRLKKYIRRVARKVVNQERPMYRYATVVSIDRYNRKCNVQYIGEEGKDPVTVNMGPVQPEQVGVRVRIAGVAGDKYIDGVMDWKSTQFIRSPWSMKYGPSQGAIIWFEAVDPNPDWAMFVSGDSIKYYNANTGGGTEVLQMWHLSATNPKGKVAVYGQLQVGGGTFHGTNYATYYRAATAQSIPASTWTALVWDTKQAGVEDDGSMLGVGGDNSYLKCGTDGCVTATVLVRFGTITGFLGIEFWDSDGNFLAEMPPFDMGALSAVNDGNVTFSATFILGAGKGVQARVRHNHSSSVTVSNGASGCRMTLAQVAA